MVSPGARGYPAGAPGGASVAGARPKQGFNFGPLTPYISFALLGLAPTIFWGIFQFGWLFDLIQEILDVMSPGMGVLGRWLVFFICPFIFPHVVLSTKIGGFTRSQYPDPKTGEPMKIYKSGFTIFLWAGLYWAGAILAVVFLKPFITDQLITPGINLLVQAMAVTPGLSENAPIVAGVAQKAGLKVTFTAAAEKTVEDRLCGVVTKYDERGNIISGGKQISVEIVDAPQIIRNAASSGGSAQGTLYRPTIRIANIGKEPIDVVVKKGQLPSLGGNPYYTITSGDRKGEPVALGNAEGSYVSGKNIDISKRDKVYFLLTPLDCLEESGGCRIEPGLDKTVELITPQKITADYELLSSDGKKTGELKELNNFVVLDENTFASLHVEVIVRYNKEDAKGEGTGHLLIIPDKEIATSIQKSTDFKKNYCSNTFSGPLDVIVTPPFYVVGNTKDGGNGYFESKQCPEGIKEFEPFGGYCMQNIKTVKIKLVNSDKESKIQLSKITVSPFQTASGEFPPEYERFGGKNCFYSFFGEESDLAIKFKDSDGTVGLNSIPAFSSDATFLCRYRINDYPQGHQNKIEIEDFKDFEFRVNVLYDYITEVETTAIQVVIKE